MGAGCAANLRYLELAARTIAKVSTSDKIIVHSNPILGLFVLLPDESVFWTITSTWPDLSIRGKKCPIGDDQLSQLSALSISIV